MVFQFAWRYLKGKKSTQAIQIISWVSIGAMAIGTAALIVVLSVFNGFEGFIKELYSDFYPQIKITAAVGKTFLPTEKLLSQIQQIKGISSVSKTLEEKVLLTFNESQVIVTMKGVDTNYERVSNISKDIKYGKMDFTVSSEIPPLVLGIGVSNRLGASEESHLPINCYAFNKDATSFLDVGSTYYTSLFEVSGVYSLQDEIDNQYVFAPLPSIQQLIQKPNTLSSIEIAIDPNINDEAIKRQLSALPEAKHLKIETRYEQNKTLYFILKSERWAVYAILTLMLIIASFNIVGSMSMLVLEKQKDISILKTMGMPQAQIKKIFIATGILLSAIGAIIGCVLAYLICILQQHYGFVKLGTGESFLIEAYPVKLHVADFFLVMTTVIVIAFFASLLPAIKAGKRNIELRVR